MKLDILHVHKDTILRIAQSYHAYNIRVFGSVARGEEQEGSDIDLLVSFRLGASLLDQAGLVSELTNVLGTKVDVVSDRALSRYLRDRVLREAQPL